MHGEAMPQNLRDESTIEEPVVGQPEEVTKLHESEMIVLE